MDFDLLLLLHIFCALWDLVYLRSLRVFVGNEYLGFVIASIIFSGAGRGLELLLSPIIDAIPSKAKAMALPKVAGDIVGFCGFAIFLGIGRLI